MFNKKKKYFKHKLDGVQKMVWDLEFKREKSLMIREEVRQEYDKLRSKFYIIETQIKAQLKTPDKICEVHNPEKGKDKVHKDKGTCACEYIEKAMEIGEIERLYDSKEILSKEIGQLSNQMKTMDIDIHGANPTNEYPEGVAGIDQQLEKLRELQVILKHYVKEL